MAQELGIVFWLKNTCVVQETLLGYLRNSKFDPNIISESRDGHDRIIHLNY